MVKKNGGSPTRRRGAGSGSDQPINYVRSSLPGIIPVDLNDIGFEPDATRVIVKRLAGALRRERARAGHWTYDLKRHIDLLRAHSAENARLREFQPTAKVWTRAPERQKKEGAPAQRTEAPPK